MKKYTLYREGEADTTAQTEGQKDKTFTQKDVDLIINARFKKERTEKEKLLTDLQQLQANQSLSEEQKTTLESQINNLQETLQTKEQQSANALKNLETKYTKDTTTLKQEAETWQNRFTSTLIDRALIDGAVTSDAESPEQIVMMFKSNTRLVEEQDTVGKGIGKFVAKMKINLIDPETKKPVETDLPVNEAIAAMREQGLHKNLFKVRGSNGTGQTGGGSAGGSPDKMPSPEDFGTPEAYGQAYQAWRKSHELDGRKKA